MKHNNTTLIRGPGFVLYYSEPTSGSPWDSTHPGLYYQIGKRQQFRYHSSSNCREASNITSTNSSGLTPGYISGFTDAEGSFGFSITRHPEMTCGYNVQLKIHITQSTHSVNVLHEIKNFFKCGTILPHNRTGDRIRYQITSIVDIVNILIPFLELHPLLTSNLVYLSCFLYLIVFCPKFACKRSLPLLKRGVWLG